MTQLRSVPLSTVLTLDAATCMAMGALMTLGARFLSPLTGLPVPLLFFAGLVLFPIAAFMAVVAKRLLHSSVVIGVIVAGNAAWVAASLWLLLSPNYVLTPAGIIFVAAQAAVVVLLTIIEFRLSRGNLASGARS